MDFKVTKQTLVGELSLDQDDLRMLRGLHVCVSPNDVRNLLIGAQNTEDRRRMERLLQLIRLMAVETE